MLDLIDSLNQEMELALVGLEKEIDLDFTLIQSLEVKANSALNQIKTLGINAATAEELMELDLIERRSTDAFSELHSLHGAEEVGLELEKKTKGQLLLAALAAIGALLGFLVHKFWEWTQSLAKAAGTPEKNDPSNPAVQERAEETLNIFKQTPIDKVLGKGIYKKYRILSYSADYLQSADWVFELLKEAEKVMKASEDYLKQDLSKVDNLKTYVLDLSNNPPKEYHAFIQMADSHFSEFYVSANKGHDVMDGIHKQLMTKWRVVSNLEAVESGNRLTVELAKTVVLESKETIAKARKEAEDLEKVVQKAQKAAGRMPRVAGGEKKLYDAYARAVAIHPLQLVNVAISKLILPYLGQMAMADTRTTKMVTTVQKRVKQVTDWISEELLKVVKDEETKRRLEKRNYTYGELARLAEDYGVDIAYAPDKLGMYTRQRPRSFDELVGIVIDVTNDEK